MKKLLLLIVLLSTMTHVLASEQDVLMIRSSLPFPEAMTSLQNAIIEHKYTLSRVQRVDIGLEKAGFKTDRYRIVFFGKHTEMKSIIDEYPEMAVYLPLKVVIFAEDEETMLVGLNPLDFSHTVDKPEYNILFKRWANDMKSIMEDVRIAE
jgi:uncharacterized protein (DUF302 family)